jgi:pilus assembly protein CpaC
MVAATLLFVFAAVFSVTWSVQAAKTDLVTVASEKQMKDPSLILTMGMADIVDIEGDISDILVADPDIVDVVALQANRLYIVGMNIGSTNVIITDSAGNIIRRMNVHVKINDQLLQDVVERLFPGEGVDVFALEQQVIMTGNASTPEIANKIGEVVSQVTGDMIGEDGTANEILVNLVKVAGDQQVMLRVKIIEASRAVLRELGINTSQTAGTGIFDNEHLRASFATNAAVNSLTTDSFGTGTILYNTGLSALEQLTFIINALETDGLINTLAEPNLTAISGEQAGFLAGGEFPVRVGTDSEGNPIIEFHDFGVALNFSPIVLSNDRISLQLQAEVSSIADANAGGTGIPSFSVRRATTTIEVPSGGSMMIAGLLQSESNDNVTDLPGIGDVPVLGDLFSSESFQRRESELVIIVNAVTVHPYKDEDRVKEIPAQSTSNALAKSFEANIRRIYERILVLAGVEDEIFNYDEQYGYLID